MKHLSESENTLNQIYYNQLTSTNFPKREIKTSGNCCFSRPSGCSHVCTNEMEFFKLQHDSICNYDSH